MLQEGQRASKPPTIFLWYRQAAPSLCSPLRAAQWGPLLIESTPVARPTGSLRRTPHSRRGPDGPWRLRRRKEMVGPTVLPPGGRNLSSCGPWPQAPVPARGRYPRALRESPARPVAASSRPRPWAEISRPRALRESPARPVAATPRPRPVGGIPARCGNPPSGPRRKSPVPARGRNRLFQASGTAGDNPSGGFAASSLYTREPYLVRLRRRAEIPPRAECSSAWSAF